MGIFVWVNTGIPPCILLRNDTYKPIVFIPVSCFMDYK